MATNDAQKVLNDYKKFVQQIKQRAEEKVEQAVTTIASTTNKDYAGVPPEGNLLTGNPIYSTMNVGNNLITGQAIARESAGLIYLEFGTRYRHTDNLSIRTGFKSGIDTQSIAAPYKSNKVPFKNQYASEGKYFFLNNIDREGKNFLRNFWK